MLLPTSLLLLIVSFPSPSPALEVPWPRQRGILDHFAKRNRPVRRDIDLPSPAAIQQPIGVRKMSEDEGEMFFPEYWNFGTPDDDASKHALDKRKPFLRDINLQSPDWMNGTLPSPLQAPFTLHDTQPPNFLTTFSHVLHSPRAIFSLSKRDAQCPNNTVACSGINQPNSCCPAGDTCQPLTIGSANVGCCAAGQSCSQQVAPCQDNYVSCPGSSGGGCCLPGYACVGQICKQPPRHTHTPLYSSPYPH